jgi:hypothetical protein
MAYFRRAALNGREFLFYFAGWSVSASTDRLYQRKARVDLEK